MRLRFGELPENHIFLYLVRPFVESCFKLITWLIVIATLEVAADLTGSRSIGIVWGVAYLLVLWFVQSFVDWVFSLKSLRPPVAKVAAKSWLGTSLSGVKWIVITAIWLAAIFATQLAVENTIKAVVQFQKLNAQP
jgi:hypothetical protein